MKTITDDKKELKTPGIGAIILSILAAAIGVQNRRNLEEDFSQSSPIPYIIGGVLFTAVFLGILMALAKLALSN